MKKIIIKIKCYLGFHKWKNIDTTPKPHLEPGDAYCYSDLHKCEHCKKEKYLGMGCVI